MKKFFSVCLLCLGAVAAFAQINVIAASEKHIIDQRPNYSIRYESNMYSLVLEDYFTEREITIELADSREHSIAALMTIENKMKTAKTGESIQILQKGRTYNIVKASGSQYLISEGAASYQMSAYSVLVPALKKHGEFVQSVVRMPYAIGNFTKSDLTRMQKKLDK